jgi:hypothetical protein
MSLPRTRASRAALAGALAATAIVVVVLIARAPAASAPPARPTFQTLLSRPRQFLGERVTVIGRLEARPGGRTAELHERGGAGALLVAAHPGVPVPAGPRLVSVTGVFDRLDEATTVSPGREDGRAANRPLIHAERIEPLQRG